MTPSAPSREPHDVRRLCEHVFVSSYVELHCHSAFSFLDGASLPEELVVAAVEREHHTLALTDHNSVSGSMEFAQAARSLGLRAIHGAEVDIGRSPSGRSTRHVTLLVRDAVGIGGLGLDGGFLRGGLCRFR